MGRTVATLAAAIVVVGVVAILVLSPWSRLVDSEADVSPSVEVTAEEPLAVTSADGIEDRVPETSVADTVVATEPTGETAVPVATDEIAAARSDAPRPSQVIGPPASRIESITWEDVDGATRVTVRADGRLLPERVAVIPMASPPRVLIRIRHIETRYEAYVLEVGTPTVTAIRTGLHPELTPPALYVVCDLAGDGIRVLDSAFDGDVMTIILGS